jgi:hypothetical protein
MKNSFFYGFMFMKKKGVLFVLFFMVIWMVVSVLGIAWENRFDWPDNVHIDYGFPFVWSTQTLSTIAGSTNLWTVDIAALIMNLDFWLGINLIATATLLYFLREK